MRRTAWLTLAISALVVGCSSMISPDPDRLGAGTDAGSAAMDGAVPPTDGAVPPVDAGGACATGFIRCGARCVDPSSDVEACGGCGMRCSGAQACVSGTCQCPASDPACSGVGNPDRCGASGATCADLQVCLGDACVCRPGLTDVGGRCVDLSSDPSNCGAPGVRCGGATPVCAGGACHGGCPDALSRCDASCVDLRSDVANCGGCGDRCDRDQVCVLGSCRDYRSAPGGCDACGGDFRTCCDYAGGSICVVGDRCGP